MPVEIEAKMKLADPPAMALCLTEKGATALGEYFETNIFFDTYDRRLRSSDQGLRLRISEDTSSGQRRYVLTHKGPNAPGQLKSRQETELTVDNAEDAERLLESLGFARCLKFQKRRASWKLDNCSIELDEVPYLGHFIEIEGHTEETIMQVRQSLGLSQTPLIKASYVAMLKDYLQKSGQPAKDILFPPTTT